MSARRSKRNTPGSTTARRRQGNAMLQALEQRLMFNTVITDSDPLTSTPATDSFEYKDARGNVVRVVVHGDVSAEFVFAKIDKNGNRVLRDAVSPSKIGTDGKLAANEEDGRDLFHVYIAQASIDSYISIAQVPSVTADDRPMQPFSGSVTLQVQPSRGSNRIKSTDGGTGSIYLGARTRDDVGVANQKNIPIRSLSFNGLGIFAAPANGKLVAGISTAADVSLGKFMFGGAISGNVAVEGSMETFYCGALLTGVTEGQSEAAGPVAPNNFHIGGDIRNILVKGSIGTDGVGDTSDTRTRPTYFTGTDFDIKGRVGQIKTGDDYLGFGTIDNNLPGLGLRTRQQEIEFREDNSINRGSFTDFENGQFGDGDAFFSNDTYETAQFLGSINSKQTGNDSVQVNGLLQWEPRVLDRADYYAVPLMAGQQVSVRLISPIVSSALVFKNGKLVRVTTEVKSDLHVGVFDPDKRLIAADYSNVSDTTSQSKDTDPQQQQLFTFTAEKPGIYRFAVGLDAPGFGVSPGLFVGEESYQMQLTGIGNLGLGGLAATGTILSERATPPARDNSITNLQASIEVVRGDLGALYTPGFIVDLGGVAGLADGGDFRAIDAASLGQQDADQAAFGFGPNILAITGSVGMIRSNGTGAENFTDFNDLGDASLIYPIGGDVQYVVSTNTMVTDLAVKGSVGVIQAKQWGAANYAGSLSVNVDGQGKPGIIDLIDITGNLGTLGAGGPLISTNAGGNVRYIHLTDGSTAFRPTEFGGSQPEETTYVQGQEADLTDDSGAQVVLKPTQEFAIDPLTGGPLVDSSGNPIVNSGTLTVLTYPIARSPTNTGGGGVVIIKVTSTRGVGVRTNGGTTEIGEIQSTGTGPALVKDPGPDGVSGTSDDPLGDDGIANSGDEPFILDPKNLQDNSIDMKGSPVDVYSIVGNNFNSIRNRTTGEIVNTVIGATGLLEGTTLGLAKSSIVSGMVTEQATTIDSPGTSEVEGALFPFNEAKNGIVINGGSPTAPAILTLRASQAIGNVVITGIADRITANSDGVGVKGVFEGINGAIYARGQLRRIEIGEGILPSGTGNMGRAGIYCIGRIEEVINQGAGSDIRGDIVSDSGIGSIQVNNGSIINADIMVITTTAPTSTGADLAASAEFGGGGVIFDNGLIHDISVSGNGGIIGLSTVSANLGPVVSVGGFGIINSKFLVLGDGRFDDTVADGYGYRGVTWFGGQSIDSITARGTGKRISTAEFSPGVRLSESLPIDPFFGTRPSALTDINIALGTTAAAPVKKGTSNSGTIDLSKIAVSRDVGAISASQMRSNVFNIGNNIGSITTTQYTDSTQVTAGRIDNILIGGDATKFDVSVSGPIGTAHIGGSFKGSSRMAASGPNGSIGSFIADNTLYGNVSAERNITSIRVGTFYGSQGTHAGQGIARFIVGQDFLSGAKLNLNKTLGLLYIGGDFQDGATIECGVLGTKTIVGQDLGDIVTV